jgi:hypothetical protein
LLVELLEKTMDLTFEIMAVIIMVGAVIWVFAQRGRTAKPKKKKEDPQTRLERAVWAWALVVNSSHGAAGLGGMLRVTLELEVHLPGTPPYTINTTWLVEQDALEYVETGKEVSLKVDPQAPEYIFPNGSWAKIVGKK